jgi:chloramphenicol-sensitive protein RarD
VKSENSIPAVLAAIIAFGCWGVLPVYWKALAHMGSDLALAHRVVWTLTFVIPLLIWRREWREWLSNVTRPRVLGIHLWSGFLLAINWGVFIWSAHHQRIVECSLGYFLNPLLNVFIGYLVLGERLSRLQKVSIALASIGVVMQLVIVGKMPWIALTLALSFGFYALARRQSPLGSLPGLAMESLIFLPLALGYLIYVGAQSRTLWGTGAWTDVALIIGLGVITAIPLLGFAFAARKLPFSLLGLLQFLAPTGQFIIGAWLYREPVSSAAIASFVFIWAAVVVFCWDLSRKPQRL